MATQVIPKRLMFRWTTLKGLIAIVLFLAVAALIEYFVVFYAVNLGVSDATLLKWSFQFPGTDWPVTIAISPLFHLVPIAAMIMLVFSWTYLTRQIVARLRGTRRAVEPFSKGVTKSKKLTARIDRAIGNFFRGIRSKLSKNKGISTIWLRIGFARATVRSALTVLIAFIAFVVLFSLLTYPQLIYRMVSDAYQNNPSLLNFVASTNNSIKGFAEAVSPIGWIGTSINSVLMGVAPAIRDAGASLGGSIKPLADLDATSKYLVFQNAAAWISTFAILFYEMYARRDYRYKKK